MAFVPRSVFAQPSAFGRVRDGLTPAEGVDPEGHRYRAALLQNTIACVIHERLRLQGASVAAFTSAGGEAHGLSADRVCRMLRGETGAQYADLAFWAMQFPEVAAAASEHILSWIPVEPGSVPTPTPRTGSPQPDGLHEEEFAPMPLTPQELAASRQLQKDNLDQLRERAAARASKQQQPGRPLPKQRHTPQNPYTRG
ncbi:hypothetical protein [Glutamicibacter protophormiae]|uniref:hypothetical protein n=1 Tax=Glutamicibacter protophormiae TaxID=37930 RepID=UPI003A91FBB0